MSTAPMRYRELPAPPAIAGVVAGLWEFVASEHLPRGHVHTIPVDGAVSIGYARPKAAPERTVFVGPRLQALQVPVSPGDVFWGIRFLPGASRAAIGRSGAQWRDKVGLLHYELPALADEMIARLNPIRSLEEAVPILEGLVTVSSPCAATAAAVLAITRTRGDIRIADIPGQIGLSERQFQRRFRDEVGLTPKQFARVCRLRAAAIAALHKEVSWGAIAADGGFSDQAHMTHEFQNLFGISPSEFESQFLTQIEHGALQHG